MGQIISPDYLIVIAIVIQIFGLMAVVMIDPYFEKKRRTAMIIVSLLIAALLVRDLVAHNLDLIGTMPYRRTICAIIGNVLRPLLIVAYMYLIEPSKKHSLAWILVLINTGVYMTALFSGIAISIDENNQFHRGPLGFTVHIISVILLIYITWISVREYGKSPRKNENIIPVAIVYVIIISVFLDTFVDYRIYPVAFVTIGVASTNVFYYIWLHLQFVREHEQSLYAEQRIQLMKTQIQPHFLYNTLSTIQALCDIDPEKASETTGKFAKYLRNNLESLDRTDRIPFEKDMEHTLIYTDIEMIRFPNIRIEQDIEDEDFTLPALTVQPIVENAIRHGVRIREEGIVRISTRRDGDCHEIVISDNGKGFDIEKAGDGGGLHIGVKNVRERIERMCGGTLDIKSRMDEGTVVTIRIPVDSGSDSSQEKQ